MSAPSACPTCHTPLPDAEAVCPNCGAASPTSALRDAGGSGDPIAPPVPAGDERRLREALADRYRVERELGRGGSALVYLAEDLKHHRRVALKVMRPELAIRPRRFLREIEIAARLCHPHILPLHDSGEAKGFLYYAMPFVEGESLRDLLRREHQLPVEKAVQITREVAEALAYAHGQGVVHRDIKPGNVLLHAGHAVVADFGIARAVVAGGGRITGTGVSVGTPVYMSPEQGKGTAQLDGRSDIYSLGCTLYELLAGHPPFTGATAQEILARHSMDPVPRLRAARPNIPEHVEWAVKKALAKAAADRFATATEFAEALTTPVPPRWRSATAPAPAVSARQVSPWLGVGIVAVGVAAALWWIAPWRARQTPVTSPVASRVDTVTRAAAPLPTPVKVPPVAEPAPPRRRPASEAPAARRGGAASQPLVERTDSILRPLRAAAIDARRRAADGGGSDAELATGDSLLRASESLASQDRVSEAVVQLSAATSVWGAVECKGRERPRQPAPPPRAEQTPAAPPRAEPTPLAAGPAPVDPRPDIQNVIDDYARALESRDVSQVRHAYPGLTSAEQQSWQAFFHSVRNLKAGLTVTAVHLAGLTAEAMVTGVYDYDNATTGRAERRPVTFRAILAVDADGWRLTTIR